MKDWQSSYLKLFNALGRVVGYVFMIGGIFFSLCYCILFYGRKVDSLTASVSIGAGLIFAILGLLLVKAKPSNPTKLM